MGWLAAGDTYEIALVDGRVVAREATQGTAAEPERPPRRTLPAEVAERPEVRELERFAEWLDRHAAECAARVTTWMVSSLPVPAGLLGQVWPDEAWQAVLRDLVVVGDGPDERGFLRDADPSGELRVVNSDGETVRLTAHSVTFPHPVLLPGLDEIRTSAAELGVVQGIEQIHRAVWRKPEDLAGWADRVTEFADAEYRSWFHLAHRAASLGYRIAGTDVVHRIRDAGRTVTASVSMSDPYSEDRGYTGDLTWSNENAGARLALTEVGPVAWSEGMRMAAALHAGRPVNPEDAQ